MNLDEIEYQIISQMKKMTTKKAKNLWNELLVSSRKLRGMGCDEFLMSDVEDMIEKRLSDMDRNTMYEIWKETENAIMAIESGFDNPDKYEMIHDVGIDLKQDVVDILCREAMEKNKNA